MSEMNVLYTYLKFGSEETEEIDSPEEAIEQAVYDQEYNKAYPVRIEAKDGSFKDERLEPMKWEYTGPLKHTVVEVRVADLPSVGRI